MSGERWGLILSCHRHQFPEPPPPCGTSNVGWRAGRRQQEKQEATRRDSPWDFLRDFPRVGLEWAMETEDPPKPVSLVWGGLSVLTTAPGIQG